MAIVRSADRRARSAFSLVELLIVMGIIALLLVALVPAVNSLSKSGGRKAAVSNLMAAVEQARSQAIVDNGNVYLIFATRGTLSANLAREYGYRSYALFREDAAGTMQQITGWKQLPTGVSFRAGVASGVGTLDQLGTSKKIKFAASQTDQDFPYIMFNRYGELAEPAASSTALQIGLFEGFVDGTTEVATGRKDASGNPAAAEYIRIARLTGRVHYEPDATPIPVGSKS